MNDDDVIAITEALNRLILEALKGAAHPQYNPGHDADHDAVRIMDGKTRAAKLREMREDFENLVSGIL